MSASRTHSRAATVRSTRWRAECPPDGDRLLDRAAAARLFAEVDGGSRIEARLHPPAPAAELLARHDRLPLNVRWGRRGAQTVLLVDVPPGVGARQEADAAAALLAAQRELPPEPPSVAAFDVDALRSGLQQAGIAPDALLAHPAALELRLRVAGGVRAVRIDACGETWRAECSVLVDVAAMDPTLVDQALRCNANVRFARLAWRGWAIAAQALVPRALPLAFLLRTTRAVAALAHHASLPLSTLHEHEEVRAAYARLVSVTPVDPQRPEDLEQGA